MRFKKIKIGILSLLVASGVLTGCTKDNYSEDFDKNPTERLNERKEELSNLLTSSEFGWKAVYFTDDTQLGGFTHLFRFIDKQNVEMISDFDNSFVNGLTKQASLYDIKLGSTVSLVFSTNNKIHLLSDSNSFPTPALRGKGYKGDFQFLFVEGNEQEIIFKTNRSIETLKFVKATAEDWDLLPKNLDMVEKVTGLPGKAIFRKLTTNDGGEERVYDFNFDSNTRFATVYSEDYKLNESEGVGIAYTDSSIIIQPAIELNGTQLSEFTYDSSEAMFVATANGVTAKIEYTSVPLPNKDYKTFLPSRKAKLLIFDPVYLMDAAPNSPLFKQLFNAAPSGKEIEEILIFFNYQGDPTFHLIQYTLKDGSNFGYFFDTQDGNGKMILKTKGQGWSGSGQPPAFLKEFNNYLVDLGGLYVKKESFKIEYGNQIYTLINADSASDINTLFRMSFWIQ